MYSDDAWGTLGSGGGGQHHGDVEAEAVGERGRDQAGAGGGGAIPCRYLIQHVGVSGEEYSDEAGGGGVPALEEISLFARQRGVEVLLENIPNKFVECGAAECIPLNTTHLGLGVCLDTGHANMMEGVEAAFELMKPRIRSTHLHDNNGKEDVHLFPLLAKGGSIDWAAVMELLRSRAEQYPLLLELRESPEFPQPLDSGETR
jgi:sugar phosphate isomerase/epimerase